MSYAADYGLFLAKIVTMVIALVVLTAVLCAILFKNKENNSKSRIKVTKLNQRYDDMEETLRSHILSKKDFKSFMKEKSKQKKTGETEKTERKRLYVIKFCGDIRASHAENLRQEITAVLNTATMRDEVVICLESAGGVVHGYGLCASQLQRIKERQIPLTVIIDKIAASGGYLMACTADKILAAPFAIIGSIGVIAQLPNFHRFLKKRDIDFEQITAGEYKRTLTLMGENTDKARQKMKEELEDIHHYFKEFIKQHRPSLDLDAVSTGEHWLASKALDLKLVDELSTSDDYLFAHYKTTDIFEIRYCKKYSFFEKMFLFAEGKISKYFQSSFQ